MSKEEAVRQRCSTNDETFKAFRIWSMGNQDLPKNPVLMDLYITIQQYTPFIPVTFSGLGIGVVSSEKDLDELIKFIGCIVRNVPEVPVNSSTGYVEGFHDELKFTTLTFPEEPTLTKLARFLDTHYAPF